MTVAGVTNCKLDYTALKKGDRDMCRVFEETWLDGKAEGLIMGKAEGKAEGLIMGKAEGLIMGKAETLVETGLEFGLTKEEIIQRLQNKLNVSLSEAEEYFAMFANKSSYL